MFELQPARGDLVGISVYSKKDVGQASQIVI